MEYTRDSLYSQTCSSSEWLFVLYNILYFIVFENKINIFLDEKNPCMFRLFVSLLRIPDVIVDEQPHHFEKFKNIIICKSHVLSIMEIYLVETDENICVSLVETIIENIRVRLRNDFFYGKRAAAEVNFYLKLYLKLLMVTFFFFLISKFKNKKLDLFIQSQLNGGDVLLKELFSFIKNFPLPSSSTSLSSFLVSSTIRLSPEMVPFEIESEFFR
jgi:hypothetical protein